MAVALYFKPERALLDDEVVDEIRFRDLTQQLLRVFSVHEGNHRLCEVVLELRCCLFSQHERAFEELLELLLLRGELLHKGARDFLGLGALLVGWRLWRSVDERRVQIENNAFHAFFFLLILQ